MRYSFVPRRLRALRLTPRNRRPRTSHRLCTRKSHAIDDVAVAQRDAPVRPGGEVEVVRDEHERRAAPGVHSQQDVDDVLPVGRVEIAGGLVREEQARLVGQRAGDGHALLLSAGELRRVMMPAPGQSDLVEQGLRPWSRLANAGQFHGHQHVLERRERRR